MGKRGPKPLPEGEKKTSAHFKFGKQTKDWIKTKAASLKKSHTRYIEDLVKNDNTEVLEQSDSE